MKKDSQNKEQKQLIRNFKETTGASENQAIAYLKRAKWNIQNAINVFFDDGVVPQKETLKSISKIEELFNQFSAQNNSSIRYMDEQKFCEFNQKYLKLQEDNVVLGYILINVMGVETSGYIEFKHFLKLFEYLKVSEPNNLQHEVPRLEEQLNNDRFAYRQLYTKIYKFYLIGNKDISLEYSLAKELWTMYLRPIMPLYSDFIAYLQQKSNKPVRVHRDLWNMVYEFATTVKDVSTVNEIDGWPVFIDEFVEYVKSK